MWRFLRLFIFTFVGNDEKWGTNPLDETLKDIVKKILLFSDEDESLQIAKKEIEKKYEIKKEHGDCWSADDIKRVWGETQSLNMEVSKRRDWAHVITLQVLKRCKPNAAHNNTNNETNQSCETRPGMKENSEDASSVRKAEPDTAGAVGGVVSEVYKPSVDSIVISGSQFSSSSTGEDPSPPEVNPIADSINSKTKSPALNEDEETSVNIREQQNDELCSADVHDKENAGFKNSLQSACGISQRVKGNSEDRSSQSKAEPQQPEQTKDTAVQPPGAEFTATKRKFSYHDNTGSDDTESESLTLTCGKRDNSKPNRLSSRDNGGWQREGSKNFYNPQTAYIGIPISVVSGDESPSSTVTVFPNNPCTLKLIDRVPNLTEIRKRKSYAVLYDNRTRNAVWVYEILNRETLKKEKEVVRKNVFKDDQSIHPFYRSSKDVYPNPYQRGHLAPAENHKWCQEACDDTFLMSNISAQHEKLNKGGWSSLEDKCRSEAEKPDIRNVHVYSGPLYIPTDDKSGVVNYKEIEKQAVPTHFFKVIIKEHIDGTAELECYMMPNEELDPDVDYTVSIEELERASGLIFTESSCSEEVTDSLRELTWKGDNDDEKEFSVKTQVNISTPQIKRFQ